MTEGDIEITERREFEVFARNFVEQIGISRAKKQAAYDVIMTVLDHGIALGRHGKTTINPEEAKAHAMSKMR